MPLEARTQRSMILAIDQAQPEQRLLASLIVQAVEDARYASQEKERDEARAWLIETGVYLLLYIVPADSDIQALQDNLLEMAGVERVRT